MNVLLILTLVILVPCNIYLCFAGSKLVKGIKVIAKLYEEKKFFSKLLLAPESMGTDESIEEWSRKLLRLGFIKAISQAEIERFVGSYTMGQIIEIVSFRTNKINHLIHELRTYSVFILILNAGIILQIAGTHVVDRSSIYRVLLEYPYESSIFGIFPIIEIGIFVLLILRFYAEVTELKELFEPIG